ncbi:MAG TPA: inorganic phosphate transporter [Polyangiaceae bacterium]|jgi:PiT family inorganic phosphate transporter|nr:inorganic phosphate transporter [Polyangiaceae bacterium]
MTTLYIIVGIALAFDFCNGFHDAANSIATVVATHVLKPHWAVIWTAFFNFVAFLLFPLHVARTMGEGIVDPRVVSDAVIAGALAGAIGWDLITWWLAMPTSSSHALVGGLIGAGVAKAGWSVLKLKKIFVIAAFIVASPIIGLVLSGGLMVLMAWLLKRRTPAGVTRWFRRLQLLSAAGVSLGHGGNDAQKTMGIIFALLISHRVLVASSTIPLWVVLACHATMGLGTLAGGWRIVRTMGMRLTKLKPYHGFCAETGGATSLFIATALGIPVSTTHTIAGGIVGVGTVTHANTLNWNIALKVVWAWLLTIQCAALIAALAYLAVRALGLAG